MSRHILTSFAMKKLLLFLVLTGLGISSCSEAKMETFGSEDLETRAVAAIRNGVTVKKIIMHDFNGKVDWIGLQAISSYPIPSGWGYTELFVDAIITPKGQGSRRETCGLTIYPGFTEGDVYIVDSGEISVSLDDSTVFFQQSDNVYEYVYTGSVTQYVYP